MPPETESKTNRVDLPVPLAPRKHYYSEFHGGGIITEKKHVKAKDPKSNWEAFVLQFAVAGQTVEVVAEAAQFAALVEGGEYHILCRAGEWMNKPAYLLTEFRPY